MTVDFAAEKCIVVPVFQFSLYLGNPVEMLNLPNQKPGKTQKLIQFYDAL